MLSKKKKGTLVFVKNLNMKKDTVLLLILNKPDKGNSKRSKSILQNKLVLSARTT